MSQNHELLNIWLQAGTALLVLATLWIYYFQLRTMRKGTRGQNSISIINYLQDKKVRKARKVVLNTLRNKPYLVWSENEKRAASLVCTSYDLVAILIFQQALVPPAIIIDNWGPSIVRCYDTVNEHILEMQKPNKMGPEYWNDFETLYREAMKTNKFNDLTT